VGIFSAGNARELRNVVKRVITLVGAMMEDSVGQEIE